MYARAARASDTRSITTLNGPISLSAEAAAVVSGADWMVEAVVLIEGAAWIEDGRGESCCVGCIFTVALGSGGLAPSGGRVMRAVSFFGAAPFCVTGSGAGVG